MTTTLAHIEVSLADMRSRYSQAAGQLTLLQQQREEKQTALEDAQGDIQVWQLEQLLFTKASEFAREQLTTELQETVTAALQAIFRGDNIRFEVLLKSLGGVPAAWWKVVSEYGDKLVSVDPEEGEGGGAVDPVSLALRLALFELSRPRPEGVLVLDEPAKMLDKERLPDLAVFLKQYAVATGRSILMITHADQLAEVADVSYRVQQVDGVSEVVEVIRSA